MAEESHLLHFHKYNSRHLFFKIGELFKMDYSAVSQIAKRFEQKSKVNDKIKESLQKVITALKKYECQMLRPDPFICAPDNKFNKQ